MYRILIGRFLLPIESISLSLWPEDNPKDENTTFSLRNISHILGSHARMMQPVLQLQEQLRTKIMGKAFWLSFNQK